jgi:threonylcarbamoyladenosine tRNA methylthiotransferase MtaB
MNRNKPRKFTITTLGCKVNQWESEAIAKNLETNGFQTIQGSEPAGICIVNTCAVTHKAAMQSRQAVRKATREFPGACIIVTGCYAQIAPRELACIDGVTRVIGHADKFRIPDMLIQTDTDSGPMSCLTCRKLKPDEKFDMLPDTAPGSRSRPFLKIQDGCNAFCSYCIVPYARGRSRSMATQEVIRQIKAIASAGYREIVLTGIHLGCFGLDLSPPTRLIDLLAQIRCSTAVDRLRLSSIEPRELGDDLIDLVAASQSGPVKICPHFHIPLQSGDDDVLERMRRPYVSAFFKERVVKIHAALPQAAIGTDVLVGFPGETEAAFENTLGLIDDLPISYLHVFPFSPRTGTPACEFGNRVPHRVVKKRCQLLRELGKQKKLSFYRRCLGSRQEVLVQSAQNGSRQKGITANYIPVWLKGNALEPNSIVKVTIHGVADDFTVWGSR